MVCGQIHAPATLPNYVHMHLMNKALRRQPAILEIWYVYFAMLCNSGPFSTFSRYVSSVGRRSHHSLNEASVNMPSVAVYRIV